MASGLDTELDHRPADGDRAEQGHRGPEAPDRASPQHQTDLTAIKTKLDALKTAAADLSDSATWKPAQTIDLLGPDQGRRHACSAAPASAATRSRSTGSPPPRSTASPTRRARPPARSRSLRHRPRRADASRSTITVAANATATDVATAINASDERARSTPRSSRTATAPSASSSPRARPAQSSDFTVDTSGLAAGAALTEDADLHAHGRDAQRARTRVDGDADAAQLASPTSIENAIPGVRLTLKGVTTSPVVGHHDPAARSTPTRSPRRSQALVDAYNAVVTSTRARARPRSASRPPTTTLGPPEGPAVRRPRPERRCSASSRTR